MRFAEPWHLRCGAQFLDEITEALYAGGAWVSAGALGSDGLIQALAERLRDERWQVEAVSATGVGAPVVRAAAPFGVEPTRLALATPSLSQHVAVVDLTGARPDDLAAWTDFARHFAKTRFVEGTGLSMLLLSGAAAPQGLPALRWDGRIRRADAGLWADIHAQNDRLEPLGDLIHAISVELLGWRLDLAQSFMQVAQTDALDPIGWLERREEPGGGQVCDFGGKSFACPLDLLRRNDRQVLHNRLWRAHLAAIFPWIEEQRQILLDRHADQLQVEDRHRETLKVSDVRELEISEIARQLRTRDVLPREEQVACSAMGAIRRNLAHRKPAHPQDLANALDIPRR